MGKSNRSYSLTVVSMCNKPESNKLNCISLCKQDAVDLCMCFCLHLGWLCAWAWAGIYQTGYQLSHTIPSSIISKVQNPPSLMHSCAAITKLVQQLNCHTAAAVAWHMQQDSVLVSPFSHSLWILSRCHLTVSQLLCDISELLRVMSHNCCKTN